MMEFDPKELPGRFTWTPEQIELISWLEQEARTRLQAIFPLTRVDIGGNTLTGEIYVYSDEPFEMGFLKEAGTALIPLFAEHWPSYAYWHYQLIRPRPEDFEDSVANWKLPPWRLVELWNGK